MEGGWFVPVASHVSYVVVVVVIDGVGFVVSNLALVLAEQAGLEALYPTKL